MACVDEEWINGILYARTALGGWVVTLITAAGRAFLRGHGIRVAPPRKYVPHFAIARNTLQITAVGRTKMPPPPTPTSTRNVSLSTLLALASFAPTANSSHLSPGPAGARRPAQHRRQHRARVQCPLPWTLTFTVKQFPHMPNDDNLVEAQEALVDGLAPYGHLAAITPVRPLPAWSPAATDTFEIKVRLHDSRTIPPSRLRVWLPAAVIRAPLPDDDSDEVSNRQLKCPYFVKVGPPHKGAVTSYCVYCHATDHLRADCVKAGPCAECGKMGHFVGTCPDVLQLRTPPRRTKRFYETPPVHADGT
ncbi:hypothetical protein V1517DRAFT_362147 [Lipomyces orientalis]|uniref:Uncharacterized protein n=1 Tax=Lipomyces orientalis TaxID=1233043 RepID=A0ACC3TM24_9ASCO